MITDIEYILNDDGDFNDGITVSPNWITPNQNTDSYGEPTKWKLYTVEGAQKELRRLKRMKGRKRLSILLGFNDHLSDWITVTWDALFGMVRHRDSRFRNCTFNQLYYISCDSDSRIINVWPAYVRNENENKDNDWGRAESLDMPDLFTPTAEEILGVLE